VLDTLGLAGLLLLQHLDSLLLGDGIGDVSEVNTRDELLRRHLSNDSPDRLVQCLGPQIPDGVDDSTESKVDDTLLGTNPSQLTVRDEVSPGLAPVGHQVLELLALDTSSKQRDGLADNLVAATNCESLIRVNIEMWGSWGRYRVTYHAVTRELGVSVQDAVGGRVVTSSVHGIGTSLVEGRLVRVS